jgi:hypothetical protein
MESLRKPWSLIVATMAVATVHASAAAPPPNPAAASHKPLFYDNDFNYLMRPGVDDAALGDAFKRLTVADGRWGALDLGGQIRTRYHHERGMGQEPGATRFVGTDNDLFLTRLRLFSNWELTERLRVYGEGILAEAGAESDYVPRPIDRNYGDFLNLFVEWQIAEPLAVRIGRQELLYGNQRLISPLDWANTRRTFEGVKVMTSLGDWAVDGFYTHLVPVDPDDLDEADYRQTFYGGYATYDGFELFTVEAYYIGYDNENPGAVGDADFSLHTCGMRTLGGIDQWLWEFEGGPQFGRQSGAGLDHSAAFCTAGFGRKLGDMFPGSPVLWVYYDYASGNTIGGDFNRFNDLFPLGHKYFGFIDAVRRQNVESPNVLLTFSPRAKLNILVWYWHFMANQDSDIVPSIGGTAPQSTTSKDLGDELDLTATYMIGPRSNALLGYSHFWRGDKILAPVDADFVYAQWELNF